MTLNALRAEITIFLQCHARSRGAGEGRRERERGGNWGGFEDVEEEIRERRGKGSGERRVEKKGEEERSRT